MDKKRLPSYWTDDLRGLNVFGVIEDTVEKCPWIVEEIRKMKQLDFFGNEIEPKKIKRYNKADFSDICNGDLVYCERCKWLKQWDEDDPSAVECLKDK